MDITPDQIKTEPPEDADPYEEHTIELGEVKYENGHVLSDTEPLKYGELKVEAMLVVENGMIRPTDVAGLPGTVDLEPGDTVKEERDEFEEAEHADHLDIEGPTIKNEPLGAALEETEAQPGPSESAELLDIEGPTIKNEPLGAALEEAEAQPGPSESAGSRPWACYHCGAVFTRKQYLILHIRCHLDNVADISGYFHQLVTGAVDLPELRIFFCSQCEYTNTYLCLVKKHFINLHITDKPYCAMRTKSKVLLSSHVKLHSKNAYKCPHCSYVTHLCYRFKEHVNAEHNQEKILFCSLCSFKTFHRMTLFDHLESRHELTYYTCSHCQLKFASKPLLANHKRKAHPHQYDCHFCDFSTTERKCMAKHSKCHIPSTSTRCKFCFQLFKSVHSLKRHELNYHQEGKLKFFSMDQF